MSEPENAFIDWTDQAGREVMPGDVIWEARGTQLQVIRAEMAPGADFPLHRHHHEQIIVILEGALEFTVGDAQRVVRAGGVIRIPSNVLHGGRVHGETRAVTVEALHPPREDFGPSAHQMDLGNPR